MFVLLTAENLEKASQQIFNQNVDVSFPMLVTLQSVIPLRGTGLGIAGEHEGGILCFLVLYTVLSF